ncbi:DJ-1/PfpI family protein [Saccharicrinis aurantiacus]|uniref:DJ-1/PfpI family protein n=1 Tax=Saccharicrinis aurantiacus TaxID=1849719 RepID=UPI00094FDC49|nr:DJ-1/PfpI family protein [Saccharicrinis aurantiacus]
MKNVLLLLAGGFEVFEASVFIDVMGWNLVDGDGTTKLVSCGFNREVKSSFSHKFVVDHLIDEINVDDFDALAIPGGFEEFGFYNEAYDEKFLNLIREFNKQDKIIATICTGGMAIGKSGILKGKRGTTYTSRHSQLKALGVNVVNEAIVVEGKVITSWNPSTAVDVASILLEMLTSKENANYIREIMGFETN